MSFGAIGVEIMAKIKIMRVVIGFTKKEKRIKIRGNRTNFFIDIFLGK